MPGARAHATNIDTNQHILQQQSHARQTFAGCTNTFLVHKLILGALKHIRQSQTHIMRTNTC